MEDAAILKALQDIKGELVSTRGCLESHIKSELTINAKFVDAFPDSDPVGHRKYHDLLIAREMRRKKWAEALIEKSMSGFLWFAMCALFIAVVHLVAPSKSIEDMANTAIRMGE